VSTAVLRNSVDVSWQAPTNWGGAPELTYTVTATPGGATCTTVGLTCRLDGLGYGSTYAISVSGANSAGSSPPATGSATIATGVPDTPTVTKVTYLPGGRARVTWKPPASDGGSKLTGYTIASTPGKARCTAKASARTCDVTGLTGGRRYAFSATAVNAKGASTASAPVAAGVLVGPASKPRDVAATLDGTRATVTWNAPSDNGGGKVISYVVRSVPAGLECTSTKPTCSISGLARGRTYTFTVYAVNTSGRGQPATSNPVTATVPIAPAPTVVVDPKNPNPIS
jgi:predicted phage tail protein